MAFIAVVTLSAVGVMADYFLKLASQVDAPLRSPWFALGGALYAGTAFGWVLVMRQLKLANIGAIYCVSTALLLASLGVIVFRESLMPRELLGLALGVISLVLLGRFLA